VGIVQAISGGSYVPNRQAASFDVEFVLAAIRISLGHGDSDETDSEDEGGDVDCDCSTAGSDREVETRTKTRENIDNAARLEGRALQLDAVPTHRPGARWAIRALAFHNCTPERNGRVQVCL